MFITEAYVKSIYEAIKEKKPLIHCITNTVTINDCANVLLACNASPVMAHHIKEVEEITSKADALVCNMGASESFEAMKKACLKAGMEGHPIIIDPVGTAGSTYRRQVCKELIDMADISCIRGNYSEIRALIEDVNTVTGVDSADDVIDVGHMKEYAAGHKLILVASGKVDIITDGKRVIRCYNGTHMMTRITGSGCMSSSVLGAFMAISKDIESVAACCCMIGAAGELAEAKTRLKKGGTMTFHQCFIDILSMMEEKKITIKYTEG